MWYLHTFFYLLLTSLFIPILWTVPRGSVTYPSSHISATVLQSWNSDTLESDCKELAVDLFYLERWNIICFNYCYWIFKNTYFLPCHEHSWTIQHLSLKISNCKLVHKTCSLLLVQKAPNQGGPKSHSIDRSHTNHLIWDQKYIRRESSASPDDLHCTGLVTNQIYYESSRLAFTQSRLFQSSIVGFLVMNGSVSTITACWLTERSL